jgi:hypothetical protein
MLRAAVAQRLGTLGQQIAGPMMACGHAGARRALVIGIVVGATSRSRTAREGLSAGRLSPHDSPGGGRWKSGAAEDGTERIEHVVSLEVPDDVIHERMKGRGRADDSAGNGAEAPGRVPQADRTAQGVLPGARSAPPINGVGSIDEIYASIKKSIGH